MKYFEFTDYEPTKSFERELNKLFRAGHVRVQGFEPVWMNIPADHYDELTATFLNIFPEAMDFGIEFDFLRDDYSGFVPEENKVTVRSEKDLLNVYSDLESKYLTEGKCNSLSTFFRLVIFISKNGKSASYRLEKKQEDDWIEITQKETPKAWKFIQEITR